MDWKWKKYEGNWYILHDWFKSACKDLGGEFEAYGSGFGTDILEDNLMCKLGKGAITLEAHPEEVRFSLVIYPEYPDTFIENEVIRGIVPVEKLKIEERV